MLFQKSDIFPAVAYCREDSGSPFCSSCVHIFFYLGSVLNIVNTPHVILVGIAAPFP